MYPKNYTFPLIDSLITFTHHMRFYLCLGVQVQQY